MKDKSTRLLIVEDDDTMRKGLLDTFRLLEYTVDSASDGEIALKMASSGKYDLILLDVMLPKVDGYTVCNQLRAKDRELPIIMLTARSSEKDIIEGLTLGADDYITKPFSLYELTLRIEAVIRRSRRLGTKPRNARILQIGDMSINTSAMTGTLKGINKKIIFTVREIELLLYLADMDNIVVSRKALLRAVWGYSTEAKIKTRTVDIHIAKLRKKIEKNPAKPRHLITHRGAGYTLHE